MKISLSAALAAATLFTLAAPVRAAETQTVTKGGVSVAVPAGWVAQEVNEPLVHALMSPDAHNSVVVLREAKADMGVKDLAEYFELKKERIAGKWDFPKLGEVQTKTLNGAPARWQEGTANLIHPENGSKIPTQAAIITLEGKDHFYFVLVSSPAKSPTVLPTVLESIKVP